jgi:GAF domain-containing protein
MSTYNDIWSQCATIIHSQVVLKEKMQAICDFLGSQMTQYDWVGFYLSDVKNKKLNLGPFYGEPTEHTSISYGKGICGQAAAAQKTFLIDNVAEEKNYIACSIHVKSEIVVPIIKTQIVVGQIDVDSHTPAAFKQEDQQLLEQICRELATYIE